MTKIIACLLIFLPFLAHSQIDNEFWFAAPDLTRGYPGESRRDSTVYLVFTSMNQATDVTVYKPADLSFTPIAISMTANSTQTVDLGNFLSQIESKPHGEVLNTGLLIRSTYPITAYYEVRGANNSDLFALKGKNALGHKFYVPLQTAFQNNQTLNGNVYVPGPRSGFIIVAREDTTTVTITPTTDIVGHAAGETFTVMLNRGQTYSCEAVGWQAGSQPAGSLIESDKEIAVTIKDDMLDYDPSNDTGADVVGDQLIANTYLGKTYILARGGLSDNQDRTVICATEDNTFLYIDGSSTPIVIDAGEQYEYNFSDPTTYFEATKKVAVLHITGYDIQLAGAVIPSLDCTGSTKVGFVRGRDRPFYLTITVRAGGENGFVLNGNPTLITGSDFQPVAGTNGYYLYARLPFNTSEIPVGAASTIENNSGEVFNLGITNGASSTSCNYGYFSSFSFLNVGSNSEVCIGDSLVLDAGPGKTAYLWNTGDTTQSLTVYSAGIYYVDAYFGSDCVASDTITVTYYEPPIDLGANDTICDGTTMNLSVQGNYLFEWQDGSQQNYFTVTDSGYYWVDITDYQGCKSRDSIHVAMSPRPAPPVVTGDSAYCQGETLNLSMDDYPGAYYRYVLPSGILVSGQTLTFSNAQPEMSGMYYGYYVVDGCESLSDSVEITVFPTPVVDLGNDITVCSGASVTLDAGNAGATYLWQDGSTEQTLQPGTTGTYYVTVTSADLCSQNDTVAVLIKPLPAEPEITGENNYCEGETLDLSTQAQPDVIYEWFNPAQVSVHTGTTFTLSGVDTADAGTYSVVAALDGCFSDTVFYSIDVRPNPVLQLPGDTSVCSGVDLIVSAPPGYAYAWSNDDTSQTTIAGPGELTLTITDAYGCRDSDDIIIYSQEPLVTAEVLPQNTASPGFEFTFTATSLNGSSPIQTWEWNFGDGQSATGQTQIHAFDKTDEYNAVLTATDDLGCQATVTIPVIVRYEFKIPDGFSPNGDGINDVFEIQGLEGYNTVSIKIFNRWGAVVYESGHYGRGRYWDGGNNTDGTYFYVLEIPGMDAKSGSVTISR